MYLSHYKLVLKPFQISPNPQFLWLGEKHKEALAMMEYVVLNNQGFLVLTGNVGTGKTTLINALVNSLGDDVLVATIFNPSLDKLEFFNHLGTRFNIQGEFKGKLDFLEKFSEFLHNTYNNNKRVLLIIDESQNLSQELLEEIRLLSNIEKEGSKLINIFFVGQDEFNAILMQKECRALRQRITTTHNIQPLRENETREYIFHRLKIGGCEEEIFTKKAIKETHFFSRGYPRLINIICDQALLTGYVKDTKRIRHPVIRECVQDLRLPGERHESNKEKSTTIGKKRKVSLGRIALYTSLLGVITLSGYLLTSTGYANSMDNCKTYYGNLFKNLELPHLTKYLGDGKIKKPVLLKVSNILPEPTYDREFEKPIYVGKNTESLKMTSKQNLRNNTAKPFSPEDFSLTIHFDYNTNLMPSDAYRSLDKIAAMMLQDQTFEISVKGYTSGLGRTTYNRKLSVFRANIVKIYLVGKGIDPGRIRAIGMGEKNPVGPNTSVEGRKDNRRVEIELAPHRKQTADSVEAPNTQTKKKKLHLSGS